MLARFTGGVAFDARVKAKRAWGFLGEGLSPADADRLAALAAEAGVSCRVLPDEAVVQPPEALPLRHLRPAAEGLFYTAGNAHAAEARADWARVRVFSAVPLKETTTFTKTVKEAPSAAQRAVGLGLMAVTGLPVGMGKAKDVKKTVQQTELAVYLDVFVEAAEGLLRLHWDGQRGQYDMLGEARRPDALGNFRLLARLLEAASPGPLRNLGFRGFLEEGKPLAALGYDSPDDYEKELRWLLTLSRA